MRVHTQFDILRPTNVSKTS